MRKWIVGMVVIMVAMTLEAKAQQIDLTCSASTVRAAQAVDCEATPNDGLRWRHYWVVEDLKGRVDLSKFWPANHNRDPHYRAIFRRHGNYVVRVGVRPRHDPTVDWAYLAWPVRVEEPWYDRRALGVPLKWWITIGGASAVAINCISDRGRLC